MNLRIGVWGGEYFGRGHFGWAQAGVMATFSLLTPALLGLLAQTTPNVQIISTAVSIGDNDVSDIVERVEITFSEDNRTAACSLSIIGETPSWLAAGLEVSIFQSFTLESGTVLTARMFSGRVKTWTPSSGGLNKTVQISCWDFAEGNLSSTPFNTTWTGTAQSLVIDELTRCGCSECDVSFSDYSISGSIPAYSTVRDLVRAVACQADEARIISMPSGRVMVWSYLTELPVSVVIGESGYTSIQRPSSQHDRYRSFTVTGASGATSTAEGTGDDDEFESILLLNDGAARAAAVIAKSERSRVVIQAPINPFVGVGSSFTVVSGSTSEKVRVTSVTHTVQWTGESSPGCWSTISGEVVP